MSVQYELHIYFPLFFQKKIIIFRCFNQIGIDQVIISIVNKKRKHRENHHQFLRLKNDR